jgi:F420-dependent oxidoreductase-like protein
LRLGLNMGYARNRVEPRFELVGEADRLGYHSVWVAEAWGSDAVSMLAWYGSATQRIGLGSAVLQMPARTPAMTAMTAATLDALSGGRFHLGLGTSGPQVAEGWHGVPFGKPLGRTREYVTVVRDALARQPLEHHGEHYRIPYDGPDATGLGKPLRLQIHPQRDIPVYLGAIGPRNVALAAEIADGWLPIFYSPERAAEIFGPHLGEGFARSGDPSKGDHFDVAATVPAVLTAEPDRARWSIRPMLALYIGAMGARGHNFYHDLAVRYGYEKAADEIQRLALDGRHREAMAAVPDALVDEVSLIGSRAAIADRLEAWKESGVTTLVAGVEDLPTLRALAELVL